MSNFPINLGDGRAFRKIYSKFLNEFMPLVEKGMMTSAEAGKCAHDKTVFEIRETIKWKQIVDEELKGAGLIDDTNLKKLCFLTVRPNDKLISFIEFKEDCRTFFQSTRMSSFEYCFEQKGTTNDTMGIGFHMHCIIGWPEEPKELLKFAVRHFKRYTAANCIQLGDSFHGKRIKNNKDLSNIRKYMSGDKADDRKAPACAIDIEWRKSLNISPLIKSREGASKELN